MRADGTAWWRTPAPSRSTSTLDPGKPVVLQGDRGYSRKGRDPGNASHYYSLTRMPSTGTLRLGERTIAITGNSWMDHEFGTSALDAGTRGWDWFALQLDDGRELMLYQLRQGDGTPSPFSSGTIVGRDGRTEHLRVGEFTVTPAAQLAVHCQWCDIPGRVGRPCAEGRPDPRGTCGCGRRRNCARGVRPT